MNHAILMHARDNVAVAASPIQAGQSVKLEAYDLQANQDIPRGHKLATRDIAKGQEILKYGEPIGTAKDDIREGDHVHIHNLDSGGE